MVTKLAFREMQDGVQDGRPNQKSTPLVQVISWYLNILITQSMIVMIYDLLCCAEM